MSSINVVLDVWGGSDSMTHVARYILPIEDALERSKDELRVGYLVNLRNTLEWGPKTSFDNRKGYH